MISRTPDRDAVPPNAPSQPQEEAGCAKLLFAELERVYRTAPVGLCLLDLDLRFVRINEQLARINGLPAEEHIGKNVHEVLPDIADDIVPIYRTVLETGNSVINHEVSWHDEQTPGLQRYFLVSYHALKGDADNVLGLGTVVQDITDRKLAEDALSEREQMLREAERNANLGSWRFDLAEGKIKWSDEMFRIFDISKATPPTFELFLDRVHPEDRERAQQRFMEKMASGATRDECEYRIVRSDGEVRHIVANASFMRSDSGEPLVVHGTSQDITERRKAEASLRESELLFRGIFEQAAVGVALLDTHTGGFVRVNEKYEELIGYSVLEMQSKTFMDITYPDDLQEDLDNMRRLHAGEIRDFSMEKRLVRSDQTVLWCNLTVSATWNRGERPVHHIAIIQDISDRKETERMLKLTQHSIDTSPIPIFWVCPDGQFQYVNQALADSLGYTIEELLSMHVVDVASTLTPALWPTRWTELSDEGSARFESVYRRKDGSVFPVDITSNYFAYLQQEYLFCLAIDISERKQHEESLREHERVLAHVSRLSTLGEMVAGIAHEINQPLSAISSYSEACSRGIAASHHESNMPLEEWSKQIGEQAIRCGEIISRLRNFVKRNETDRQRVDLNKAITDSISLVASDALRQSVRVCRDLNDEGQFVRGNEVQLQQVIVNLLRNAYEAVGESDCADRRVIVRSRRSSDAVHLDIEDHGPGVAAGVGEKLFDAFFTTKPDGLGMGLAISRSIVESHGGRLRLEPNHPQGAKFRIELPLAENQTQDD